jgi:hypothetical protein
MIDFPGLLAERTGALREPEYRGLRILTIDVSEDDLRLIAEHDYEGAAGTDHDQRAQVVSVFIADMLAASIGERNGVTTVPTPLQ